MLGEKEPLYMHYTQVISLQSISKKVHAPQGNLLVLKLAVQMT